MQHSEHVVIIGGGIIGCSIAYYLSKSGVAVTVLERGEIGSQASGAAAGLFSAWKPLAQMDAYNRLLFVGQSLLYELIAELEDATGIDLEYERSGTLRTIQHASRMEKLRPWVASCRAVGLPVELLDEEETRQREPLLSPDICGALLLPGEGQVRAQRVVEALAKAATAYGATFTTHEEIVALQQHKNKVSSVTTAQGEVIACDYLVLAPGAWAAHCGRWLNLTLPVTPQRGQLLSLRQPPTAIHHIVIGKGIYVAPKKDGTIIVGATKEDIGFDARVTAGGAFWLLDWALKLMPALEQCTLERVWSGLRPKTPDNYPILGIAPGWENVALALGHHSFGILLSAITGQSMAELITSGHIPPIIKPFSLERFMHPDQETNGLPLLNR
jgi:glycine oxidase